MSCGTRVVEDFFSEVVVRVAPENPHPAKGSVESQDMLYGLSRHILYRLRLVFNPALDRGRTLD